MTIKRIDVEFNCVRCENTFSEGFEIFNRNLCPSCLGFLGTLIANTLHEYKELERAKNSVNMLPSLERALERAKNMTTEEYLEFLSRIPPMDKDFNQGWDYDD